MMMYLLGVGTWKENYLILLPHIQHVSPKVSGKSDIGRTISYWCFAPSVAMEELSNLSVRSIIVTSGTLSPLPSYSMELGIPFPHTLENPHIIEGDQVHVRVIGKGVSGKLLSSSYERRQDGEYFSELGSTLASLSKVIPAGMLIFFPSYGVMETCIERWGGPSLSRPNKPTGPNAFFAQRKKLNNSKQYAFPRVAQTYNTSAFGPSTSSPWKRMLTAKAIVVEPRTSVDLPHAISEFKRFLEMHKSSGCILMGVCRGKISEGIDFAHDMSRAVIITGIPFAPAFDAKVKMKREFLDSARTSVTSKPHNDAGFGDFRTTQGIVTNSAQSKLSGGEWYMQQAHRAVNQAIGRVIRNKSDYGAILLLDSRFDQPRNQEGLSRWVRPHIQKDEGFGTAVRALGAFYREASAQARKRSESKPVSAEELVTDRNFSEDDTLGSVKSVAIISAAQSTTGDHVTDIGDDGAYVAPGRVVARVSVDKFNGAIKKTAVPEVAHKPNAGQSFDGLFKRKATTASMPHRKSAAYAFMEKTRLLMTANEQATIRKLIVVMKKQGDRKDIKGFRRSASGIIGMILRTEKHDSAPRANDERMLFLFLELVPPAYRSDFELIALQQLVEASSFGQQCKENLPSGECTRVYTAVVSTLHLSWFGKDSQDALFIQHAEVAMSLLCKNDRVASQTMLKSLMSLLPQERHEICRRLFDAIDTSRRIEQRKMQHRRKGTEPSIDMNRFLPATVANARSFGHLNNSHTKTVSTATGVVAKTNTSPIESAMPSSARATEGTKCSMNPYKRMKTKGARTETIDGTRSFPVSSEKSTEATSMTSILKSIESDPCVYRRKPSRAVAATGRIKSNAPSGLICPICSTQMKKPFIAPCGHLACMDCWRDWLKRSGNCATCRAPTQLESISIAVFQSATANMKGRASGASVKTDVVDDHSDAELELY
jgi:hypothetical protein